MRPRWPSTGRGRAPTHLQGRSAAEDGRRRLSCLARNAEGEAARQGKKVVTGRCDPGARGEADPVQIGPSKDAPGTASPNRAGRRRRERPHCTPPRIEDGSPRHQPRREPTPVRHHRRRTDHDRPSRPRLTRGNRFHRGRTAWTARRTKDRTRERAPSRLSATPYLIIRRIRDGRVEAAEPTAPPWQRRPTSRRPTAGGARRPRSMEKARTPQGGRTEVSPCRMRSSGRGSSPCPIGPVGRKSKSRGRVNRQWLKWVDHRRWPSLRRFVMSAFGPPPAPLALPLRSPRQPAPQAVPLALFALSGLTTRSGQGREDQRKNRRP